MQSNRHKLTTPSQFRTVMRQGKKTKSRRIIVYTFVAPLCKKSTPISAQRLSRVPGPRVGFIIGKPIGNAVTRHRLTRQLRAITRPLLTSLPANTDMVIRALPGAADVPFAVLERDIYRAVEGLC